jgi:hypothetical protein
MLRSVTGIDVVPPRLELSTSDAASSPGLEGALALSFTLFVCPGARVNLRGETEPKEANR